MDSPEVILIGGPNGAGKTTISDAVIAEAAGVPEFVNADTIAKGLAGFDPDRAAFAAGRIMPARLKELAVDRVSFAFESTLASRSFAPWIERLITTGYRFQLVYVWIESADLAVRRVRLRMKKGGHFVPPDTIRRRYGRSVANFLNLYLPLASRWRVYNNSLSTTSVVAHGSGSSITLLDASAWRGLQRIANETSSTPEEET